MDHKGLVECMSALAIFLHDLHKGNVSSSTLFFCPPTLDPESREQMSVGTTLVFQTSQLVGSWICGFRAQEVSVQTVVKVALVEL